MSWYVAIYFELNVIKTKEIIMDFRLGVHHPNPVNINGEDTQIVHSCNYPDTTIDYKLSWDDNSMNLYKKGQQRLYFQRKLNAMHINKSILMVSMIHL